MNESKKGTVEYFIAAKKYELNFSCLYYSGNADDLMNEWICYDVLVFFKILNQFTFDR